MHNSFPQKVILTLFFAVCTAGLAQFYRHMVWRANEEINSQAEIEKAYHSPHKKDFYKKK